MYPWSIDDLRLSCVPYCLILIKSLTVHCRQSTTRPLKQWQGPSWELENKSTQLSIVKSRRQRTHWETVMFIWKQSSNFNRDCTTDRQLKTNEKHPNKRCTKIIHLFLLRVVLTSDTSTHYFFSSNANGKTHIQPWSWHPSKIYVICVCVCVERGRNNDGGKEHTDWLIASPSPTHFIRKMQRLHFKCF